MLVTWEIPIESIEANFKFDHRLEGEVRVDHAEYDSLSQAIVIEFDLEPEDAERVPESDTDGHMIRID